MDFHIVEGSLETKNWVQVLQEGGPLPGPQSGILSNTLLDSSLRKELSEETPVLTKQETVLGKGTRVESSRVSEPRRTALLRGLQSWVL